MTQDTQTLINSEQTVNYRYCTCAFCSGLPASDLSTAPMAGTTPSYEIDLSWLGLGQREKLAFLQSNQIHLDSRTKQSNPQNITYSFYNSDSEVDGNYWIPYVEKGEMFRFTKIPEKTRQNFREFLEGIELFVNLNFTEVAAGLGQLRIGSHNTITGGYANYPGNSPQHIWIDDSGIDSNNQDLFENWYSVLWHEFGHSLGLSHPYDYNNNDLTEGNISKFIDINLLSQMSYVDAQSSAPYNLAPLDFTALVAKYGSANSSLPIRFLNSVDTRIASVQFEANSISVNIPLSTRYQSWISGTPSKDEIVLDSNSYTFLDAKIGYLSSWSSWFVTPQIARYGDISVNVIGNSIVRNTGGIFILPADEVNFHQIETVKLGSGNDEIVLGDYFKNIFSGAGNDKFNGFEGGVSIDGGIGNDSLSIDDKSVSYQISGGKLRKTASLQSPMSEMYVSSVESITFSDRHLNISSDTSGNPGQIYRVYKAVFNRDPMTNDMKGLGYWIKQTDNGMQLQEVAARFIDSNEFRLLYGTNPTNSEYLTKVYSNVLGRMPDKAGFDWWISEMNTNPTKTKVKVLTDFSESPENQLGVASLIGNGIVFEPWTG